MLIITSWCGSILKIHWQILNEILYTPRKYIHISLGLNVKFECWKLLSLMQSKINMFYSDLLAWSTRMASSPLILVSGITLSTFSHHVVWRHAALGIQKLYDQPQITIDFNNDGKISNQISVTNKKSNIKSHCQITKHFSQNVKSNQVTISQF